MDSHPAPGPEDSSVGTELAERTVPVPEEAVPENTTVSRSVPHEKPEDPQCTGVCNKPVSDSQDTKPADPACLAHVQERLGVPVDDPVTPGSPRLQATTGTQTDKTTQPRLETLEESTDPETLKKTVTPRAGAAREQQNTTRRPEKG